MERGDCHSDYLHGFESWIVMREESTDRCGLFWGHVAPLQFSNKFSPRASLVGKDRPESDISNLCRILSLLMGTSFSCPRIPRRLHEPFPLFRRVKQPKKSTPQNYIPFCVFQHGSGTIFSQMPQHKILSKKIDSWQTAPVNLLKLHEPFPIHQTSPNLTKLHNTTQRDIPLWSILFSWGKFERESMFPSFSVSSRSAQQRQGSVLFFLGHGGGTSSFSESWAEFHKKHHSKNSLLAQERRSRRKRRQSTSSRSATTTAASSSNVLLLLL